MADGPTILTQPDFNVSREAGINFLNSVISWAKQLNEIVGGGISVKLSMAGRDPAASFFWNGKEMLWLYYRYDGSLTVGRVRLHSAIDGQLAPRDRTDAWKKVFQPRLKEMIEVRLNALMLLKGRIEERTAFPYDE